MLRSWLLLIPILLLPTGLEAQTEAGFDRWFRDETMRIDYFHVGNARQETITLDQVYRYGIWAGNPGSRIDPFGSGRYAIKVYDTESGELIFSRGFDSYFGEYRTTDPAIAGIDRTYHESALIPYPQQPIHVAVEKRGRDNQLFELFRCRIDPDSTGIIREASVPDVQTIEMGPHGDPHRRVDLVFVAEGYTAEEIDKAVSDLERFLAIMFAEEPYRSHREEFNIYGVFRASAESGVDEPTRGIYRRTAINASFNALGLPRYLLTEDNRSLRDITACVPCDAIMIMVNSERYGGGGIYNWYAVSTVDNALSGHVFLHEFGHSFGGLADEYYASTVAYNEFYPRGVEPTESNITALLDPAGLKWKYLLTPDTPIPTPWGKEEYDGIPARRQALRREAAERIHQLEDSGASEAEIQQVKEDLEKALKELDEGAAFILANPDLQGVVGAFEGAGYAAQGLYRPMLTCLMFRNTLDDRSYCRVCQEAIRRVILFHTGGN